MAPISDLDGKDIDGKSVSRRRFIALTAAAAGICLTAARARSAGIEPVTWRGYALGSQAEVKLYHPDRAEAERIIRLAVGEVRRLEGLFSLFGEDSALLTLNRTGFLEAPAAEFVELLEHSRLHHRLSGGAFDPTVQPLWRLYADYFSRADASADGPSQAAVAEAAGRVGMEHVIFDRDRVVFRRPGMAMTLNGIAQGYITDKAVELMRRNGIAQSLVDFGEIRAIGGRPDGTPWQVAIEDPAMPGAVKTTYNLDNRAIATSGGYGFRFRGIARFNHIFDPRNGCCSSLHASVSVVQPTAAAADAMATAACLMTEAEIGKMLSAAGGGEAWIIAHSGAVSVLKG